MLLKDFYRRIILTEETAVTFLQENSLMEPPQEEDVCHRCGGAMQEKRKRDEDGECRSEFYCPQKECQTSPKKEESFYNFMDLNNKLQCNLSLCEILELVFFFIKEIPINTAVTLTGKSSSMINDWYNLCREVCGIIISQRQQDKVDGKNGIPIPIDDLRLAFRRKNNRGRVVNTSNNSPSEESDADAQNNSNDKGRVDSGVEQSWLDAKTTILRKMRGVNSELFQSHLDHFCWKVLRKDAGDLFVAFLHDVQSIYS